MIRESQIYGLERDRASWSCSTLPEHRAPVVLLVLGFRAGGLRRKGQWLPFVGFEVLGHGPAFGRQVRQQSALLPCAHVLRNTIGPGIR